MAFRVGRRDRHVAGVLAFLIRQPMSHRSGRVEASKTTPIQGRGLPALPPSLGCSRQRTTSARKAGAFLFGIKHMENFSVFRTWSFLGGSTISSVTFRPRRNSLEVSSKMKPASTLNMLIFRTRRFCSEKPQHRLSKTLIIAV